MLTLTEQCLELSYRDRLNLCCKLQDSILKERSERVRKPRNLNRGRMLLEMIGEILEETIPEDARNPRYVWARAMVVYQLTYEGFTLMEIGNMIGRNHSTIIHLRNKMQDALDYDYAYQDIIDIWKQFQNNLQNETHERTN